MEEKDQSLHCYSSISFPSHVVTELLIAFDSIKIKNHLSTLYHARLWSSILRLRGLLRPLRRSLHPLPLCTRHSTLLYRLRTTPRSQRFIDQKKNYECNLDSLFRRQHRCENTSESWESSEDNRIPTQRNTSQPYSLCHQSCRISARSPTFPQWNSLTWKSRTSLI